MSESLKVKLAGLVVIAALLGSAGYALAGTTVGRSSKGSGRTPAAAPVSHESPAPKSGDGSEASGEAVGPDATGPAGFGLCTAWAAAEEGRDNGRMSDAVAFQNLGDAAADADESIADFCAGVAHPGHGSEGHAPVTPNHGAAGDAGTSIATSASGGRDLAGLNR